MGNSDIAICVDGVSKTYRLWDSPSARLVFPFRRLINKLLPKWAGSSNNVRGGFHEFNALHEISLNIRKGESWGFIGVNGSGKSTLLKIISGNLRPSSGRVEIEGKVAILDYSSGLNGEFTGRANIFHKGMLLGLTLNEVEKRIKSIIEFADIGEFIDQPVKTYSSGMTARLGFAIMAHADAEILITDEALAVGDAYFVQKAMRHIRSFLKRGTFLFVSHSVNDVMSLCSHAVWLSEGKVVQIGAARDVCQAYISFIDRKKSQDYVELNADTATSKNKESNFQIEQFEIKSSFKQKTDSTINTSISREELAALRNYYAPPNNAYNNYLSRKSLIEIEEQATLLDDLLECTGAVGGGKIFSVVLTDQNGNKLTSVLGGEIVCLEIKAIAEKLIRRPILGFQLKNRLGLPVVAENTFPVSKSGNVKLNRREVISAKFHFMMPLIPVGEYMIRAGFADGIEDDNSLLDVKNEALLLHCTTSGVRHGLAGLPIIKMDVKCEQIPTEAIK